MWVSGSSHLGFALPGLLQRHLTQLSCTFREHPLNGEFSCNPQLGMEMQWGCCKIIGCLHTNYKPSLPGRNVDEPTLCCLCELMIDKAAGSARELDGSCCCGQANGKAKAEESAKPP
uniref:Uncharacterized protein n=1 Tax=Micrurus corallinus TaxID=54390 RepID=A0A2D4F4M5_MICCO